MWFSADCVICFKAKNKLKKDKKLKKETIF